MSLLDKVQLIKSILPGIISFLNTIQKCLNVILDSEIK